MKLKLFWSLSMMGTLALLSDALVQIQNPCFMMRRTFRSSGSGKATLSSRMQNPVISSPWIKTSQDCQIMSSATTTRLKATSKSDLPPAVISTITSVPPQTQAILVISSILILAGYHILLFRKEFQAENSDNNVSRRTWRQYQADTREDWAKYVRETDGWLYAIQSLRNAITAQTFLATTVLSLLTLITGKMWDIIRSTTAIFEQRLLTVQLSSIALTMLMSAYQFLQGVRLMTHVGFMFPVVAKDDTKVDKIMRRTQNCQWLGLRWMYISLGPIFWVVGGSRAFFVSSLMLWRFFRSIDKEPEGMQYEQFQGSAI